jgi:hypothetical protein
LSELPNFIALAAVLLWLLMRLYPGGSNEKGPRWAIIP